MPKAFALVDCNSFYASCEKLFRPDLANEPVVVLSNNDGCIVARSAEAKALGLKMALPVFKVRDDLTRHGVHVFSSNYALYADISERVMSTLESLAPALEVYSIDEAFLDLDNLVCADSLDTYGRDVKAKVERDIGVPVCVGIGATKTLAKLANYAAKKYPATQGVVDLTQTNRTQKLMSITPASEVWGVGRRTTEKLEALGVHSALELSQMDLGLVRKRFSVVLENTVRELRGQSCIDLESVRPTKQQIVCSRSFGQRITTLQAMNEAIATYAAKASEKLRAEGQECRHLSVFIRTSPFAKDKPYYSNSRSTRLLTPTADTRVITKVARGLLQSLWEDGHEYMKAGVMLGDFSSCGSTQADLFLSDSQQPKHSEHLMSVVDRINKGRLGKVWLGSQGVSNSGWQMNRNSLSPSYTTKWSDLPVAR